jgi:hypothetical protein
VFECYIFEIYIHLPFEVKDNFVEDKLETFTPDKNHCTTFIFINLSLSSMTTETKDRIFKMRPSIEVFMNEKKDKRSKQVPKNDFKKTT